MPNYRAKVKPDQAWGVDGTADVTPQPPCPISETRNLPLEHRQHGTITILKKDYPEGLVVMWVGVIPDGESAILPLRTSGGDKIEVGEQEVPDGVVGWFTES